MSFRSNLKSLYKGEIYNMNNSQKTVRPSYPGVVCWMGLTGYQAAVLCLGKELRTENCSESNQTHVDNYISNTNQKPDVSRPQPPSCRPIPLCWYRPAKKQKT